MVPRILSYLTLLCICFNILALSNTRPIIGITTQPVDENNKAYFRSKGINSSELSYIAASYIKWAEMGGARVVPVFDYASDAELYSILPKLNGIIFPGG